MEILRQLLTIRSYTYFVFFYQISSRKEVNKDTADQVRSGAQETWRSSAAACRRGRSLRKQSLWTANRDANNTRLEVKSFSLNLICEGGKSHFTRSQGFGVYAEGVAAQFAFHFRSFRNSMPAEIKTSLRSSS